MPWMGREAAAFLGFSPRQGDTRALLWLIIRAAQVNAYHASLVTKMKSYHSAAKELALQCRDQPAPPRKPARGGKHWMLQNRDRQGTPPAGSETELSWVSGCHCFRTLGLGVTCSLTHLFNSVCVY